MRSSACVVMATKAVAALLRNKMAGAVWLSLASSSSSSPFLSPFSLVSVKWSRLVVTPNPPPPTHHHHPVISDCGPSCPLTLLPILSLQPSIHFTYVSQQESGSSRSRRCSGDALTPPTPTPPSFLPNTESTGGEG